VVRGGVEPPTFRFSAGRSQTTSKVGWDNLGQTVRVVSIFGEEAAQETERLLTPGHLMAPSSRFMAKDEPSPNSIFDLTHDNLVSVLSQLALNRESFKVQPEDFMLLAAADWIADQAPSVEEGHGRP
jgi:hypothetical protein